MLKWLKEKYTEYKEFSKQYEKLHFLKIQKEKRWICECRRRGQIFPISELNH